MDKVKPMPVKELKRLMEEPEYKIDPVTLHFLIKRAAQIDSVRSEVDRILLAIDELESVIHNTAGTTWNWKEECEDDFQVDLALTREAITRVASWGLGDAYEILNELGQPVRERAHNRRKGGSGDQD